jgi:hypothetical protein
MVSARIGQAVDANHHCVACALRQNNAARIQLHTSQTMPPTTTTEKNELGSSPQEPDRDRVSSTALRSATSSGDCDSYSYDEPASSLPLPTRTGNTNYHATTNATKGVSRCHNAGRRLCLVCLPALLSSRFKMNAYAISSGCGEELVGGAMGCMTGSAPPPLGVGGATNPPNVSATEAGGCSVAVGRGGVGGFCRMGLVRCGGDGSGGSSCGRA